MLDTAFHPYAIRRGLIQLINSQPNTHGLTLNSDRPLSVSRIKSIFSTFCVKLDREIHGTQRVKNIPSADRLNAIAFPEHLETNAHLHALADLSHFDGHGFGNIGLERLLRNCWLQSTHGAGSVDVQRLTSDGYAWYATKATNLIDPTYFLSSDFHPF